jgi:hypothetical protein
MLYRSNVIVCGRRHRYFIATTPNVAEAIRRLCHAAG